MRFFIFLFLVKSSYVHHANAKTAIKTFCSIYVDKKMKQKNANRNSEKMGKREKFEIKFQGKCLHFCPSGIFPKWVLNKVNFTDWNFVTQRYATMFLFINVPLLINLTETKKVFMFIIKNICYYVAFEEVCSDVIMFVMFRNKEATLIFKSGIFFSKYCLPRVNKD